MRPAHLLLKQSVLLASGFLWLLLPTLSAKALPEEADPEATAQAADSNAKAFSEASTLFGLPWQYMDELVPWLEREEIRTTVSDNGIWLLVGKYSNAAQNGVCHSSDGKTWSLCAADAPWPPRAGFTAVSFHNRFWLFGGECILYFGDIWSSEDGVTWRMDRPNPSCMYDLHGEAPVSSEEAKLLEPACWTPRDAHGAAVHNGQLFVAGGTTCTDCVVESIRLANDVWTSSDAIHWTQLTGAAPWSPRCDFAFLSFKDRLWVIGGETECPFGPSRASDEVWRSTDGKDWELAGRLPGGPLAYATACTDGTAIYLLGGHGGKAGPQNRVWRSENGEDWRCIGELPLGLPRWAASTCVFKNQLFLFGGMVRDRALGDVWFLNLEELGYAASDR